MKISAIDAFEAVRKDASNEGKVFKVTKSVFKHYSALTKSVTITPAEISRIDKLLGGKLKGASGWGITRTCTCNVCGHVFTFADHVESALKSGVHTADELLGFLNGTDYLLTVDTLRTRDVSCTKCSSVIVTPHCCYTGSRYAYV